MNVIQHAILETLAYFEQFNRALTLLELHQYLLGVVIDVHELHHEVNAMQSEQRIIVNHDLIALSSQAINQTLHRAPLLKKRRAKALKIAQIIYNTPGVSSVILMNSTALQTLSPASDIDFMIITEPRLLYLSRTLVVSKLKRLKLMKSQQDHAGKACLGYWLTTTDLELRQHQTEMRTAAYWIASMVPLAGISSYRALIRANAWVYQYVPNWQAHTVAHLGEIRKSKSEIRRAILYRVVDKLLFPLHRARVLSDPEFRHSTELVCTLDRLKLHSVDKRPDYAKKMKSILDIYLQND